MQSHIAGEAMAGQRNCLGPIYLNSCNMFKDYSFSTNFPPFFHPFLWVWLWEGPGKRQLSPFQNQRLCTDKTPERNCCRVIIVNGDMFISFVLLWILVKTVLAGFCCASTRAQRDQKLNSRNMIITATSATVCVGTVDTYWVVLVASLVVICNLFALPSF